MNILFITNYSKKFGGGHLNRCNKLAKKLVKKNNIFFLVDKKDQNISKLIVKNSTLILNKDIFSSDKTVKILKDLRNPIVIIDSYQSNAKFEKKIYSLCHKLIVIDDKKKKHFCDVYINPNFLNFKFISKVDAKIKLVGTKFAFIDSEKIKKNYKKVKTRNFKNILVFMGATDSRNLSVKIYNAIKNQKINYLKFTFIEGYNNERLRYIKKKNELKNVKFLNFSDNFFKYLDKTDVFISSGGSSIWESIFLNKKTLIFNHSSKQLENSFNLEKIGIVKQFKKKLTDKNISKFLISETRLDNKNIFKGKNLLDSKGIYRIIKKI